MNDDMQPAKWPVKCKVNFMRHRILTLLAQRDLPGKDIVFELEEPNENVYAELVAMEAKREVAFVRRRYPKQSVWVSMVDA